MPTYTYFCDACRTHQTAYRKIDARDDCPACDRCAGATERRITPTMVSVFTPYTTPCYDKESGGRMVIRNQAEHRAFLARNGLEEVGNDPSMKPLPQEEIAYRHREQKKALADTTVYEMDPDTHEASLGEAA